MEINIREVGDVCILDIEGRLDINVSNKIRENLDSVISNGKKKIVFNLREVDFINSSGLGILVSSLKKIKENGGVLKILNLQNYVKELFEISQLIKVFEIYDDESTAVKSF